MAASGSETEAKLWRFLQPETVAASGSETEAKLQRFLQWLQANGGELRGCSIKHYGSSKGFRIFTNEKTPDSGIAMVVPLDLAITPMKVLHDPLVGPRCQALYEDGEINDRLLLILFLMVECRRPGSPWKPYLDMLPSTFGNSRLFTQNELAEIQGTTLYITTQLQKKNLEALHSYKMKRLFEEILQCDEDLKSTNEGQFQDFLWANSIYWTRAMNIPFPRSYVFPVPAKGQSSNSFVHDSNSDVSTIQKPGEVFERGNNTDPEVSIAVKNVKSDGTAEGKPADTVWVEGLIPGIDFCNHSPRPTATWEVDAIGCLTGSPTCMYLTLAEKSTCGREISINYGDK